jgi:hypothetical protein
MKNINVGAAGLMVSSTVTNLMAHLNEDTGSKGLVNEFISVVGSSTALKLEFDVYNNLEHTKIESGVLASKYIDNNINLFETYTVEEINEARKGLNKFKTTIIESQLTRLHDAIDALIMESVKAIPDVNRINESYGIVMGHIMKPEEKTVEAIENEDYSGINEAVLEIATNKFNEKYDTLDEGDIDFMRKMMNTAETDIEKLFGGYKESNIVLLEEKINDNTKVKITETIEKIKNMEYVKGDVDKIIKLHDLKKTLIG